MNGVSAGIDSLLEHSNKTICTPKLWFFTMPARNTYFSFFLALCGQEYYSFTHSAGKNNITALTVWERMVFLPALLDREFNLHEGVLK